MRPQIESHQIDESSDTDYDGESRVKNIISKDGKSAGSIRKPNEIGTNKTNDIEKKKTATERFEDLELEVHQLKSKVSGIDAKCLEMLNLLKSQPSHQTKRRKSSHRVPLYEDSESECEFDVDSDRMTFAMNANTGCAFASRILSALFDSVDELYNRSWSGQRPRTKVDEADKPGVKKALDKKKRSALEKAAKKKFPNDSKVATGLSRSIGNKLACFQELFEKWKSGSKVRANEIDGLLDADEQGTKDFNLFKDDPKLFDNLDENEHHDPQDL